MGYLGTLARHIGGVISVFLFIYLLSLVTLNLDFLNPFEQTLKDFRLTDLYFSKLRDDAAVARDTNIVLVNIGELPRDGIAEQINILSECQPKVIGLDALFDGERDAPVDSALSAAFERAQNVVLACSLARDTVIGKEIYYDSMWRPIEKFSKYVELAYANMVTEETGATNDDFATCRVFSPFETLVEGKNKPKRELFLSTAIARRFDAKKVDAFLAQADHREFINFRGNWNKFTVLDVDDVLKKNFTPELIKGKIVLMGYMGSDYTALTWDGDRFYTPLNANLVGRTLPDMYGVVVHANIISMLLEGNDIKKLPTWINYGIVVLLVLLNVVIFSFIYYNEKLGLWYDVCTKVIQFFEVALLAYASLLILDEFGTIIETGLAMLCIALVGDLLEVYLAVAANLANIVRKRRLRQAENNEAESST
ncbi:MAG: CHASE2 domain-containing protein [Cytophagales bacterium]|nr:MAG: CHASE2 domain-containing protein [Cytophagales bacterium]TAF61630.1 MAG: CHASE2 domain-containing protein [Cytophagales bacterium]